MPIRTFLDLPNNEAGLVEKYIGTAYDVVNAVYKDLPTIDSIPGEVVKYGTIKDSIEEDIITNTILKNAIAASVNSNADILNVINSLHDDTVNKSASAVSANTSSQDILAQVKQAQTDVDTNSAIADKSAQEALNSKQLAESLVKTAYSIAKTYASTGEGIVNTTNGQYFNVVGSGNVYSYSYINKDGTAVLQSTMPSIDYIKYIDDNKVSKSGDTVKGTISADALTTEAFSAYKDGVYVNYGGSKTAFQYNGSLVTYASDGSAQASLNNGSLWIKGAITSSSTISATASLYITSANSKNSLGLYSDDDGVVRMYNKKDDGAYKGFLASDPDMNLDFYAQSGSCLINRKVIWHQGNQGSGSGLDADTVDGLQGSDLVKQSDFDTVKSSLQSQIDNRMLSDYGRLPGGQRGYSAYVLNNLLNFSFKDDDGNDFWYHFRTSEDTQTALDTKFDKTGGQVNGNVTTAGSLSVLQMLQANWLQLVSSKGVFGFEVHTDDDGVTRMYGGDKSDPAQQLLSFNPKGALDLYSADKSAYINGSHIFSQSFMGAGSGLDADTLDGFDSSYFAQASALTSVNNAKVDRTGDTIEYLTVNNGFYTNWIQSRDRKTKNLDLYYGATSTATFQTDGNLNLIKDNIAWANFMPNGSHIDMLKIDKAYAGFLELYSNNTQNLFDQHVDDDGVSRLFGKNSATDLINFLQFDPSNALDLFCSIGASGFYINGQHVFSQGFMGSGSGLDADHIRGLDPVTLCGSGDVQNGLNGWTRLSNSRIDMWFAGDWQTAGSGEKTCTFNFPKSISQTDMVLVCTQVQPTSDTDMTGVNRTDVQYQIISWTNSSVTVFKQISGNEDKPTRPLFTVKGTI